MGSLRVNDDGILHDSCTEALSRIYRHRERNKTAKKVKQVVLV